jgi:hypothetical protein
MQSHAIEMQQQITTFCLLPNYADVCLIGHRKLYNSRLRGHSHYPFWLLQCYCVKFTCTNLTKNNCECNFS